MRRAIVAAMMLSITACQSGGSGAAPTATQQPSTAVATYDGLYNGDMDKIISGDPKLCTSTSHKSLKISGGTATIVGEPDTRTGSVNSDGTLTMSGTVTAQRYPATLTGRFSNDGFQGTSVIGKGVCQYGWTLQKS